MKYLKYGFSLYLILLFVFTLISIAIQTMNPNVGVEPQPMWAWNIWIALPAINIALFYFGMRSAVMFTQRLRDEMSAMEYIAGIVTLTGCFIVSIAGVLTFHFPWQDWGWSTQSQSILTDTRSVVGYFISLICALTGFVIEFAFPYRKLLSMHDT